MSRVDEILYILEALASENPQVKACMVAKKGLEGLIMFPSDFKQEVSSIWEPLSRNVNDILEMVSKYSGLGLERAYTQVLGYGVSYTVISGSDTALIVFLKGKDPLSEAASLSEKLQDARDRISAVS